MNIFSVFKIPAFLKEVAGTKVMHRERHKTYSESQFDAVADRYDQENYYWMVKEDYPAILSELAKEPFSSLLDCGCGTGAVLALLSREYPGARLTGVDLSSKMIARAAERALPNAGFLKGDCEELPFEDGSFDVVLCCHSFHHYPRPERFFAEAARVLKPGGRLILRDNTGGFFYLLRQNLYRIPKNNFKFHDGDVRFYSVEKVRSFCVDAGLAVECMEERDGHKLHGAARKPEDPGPAATQ